MSNVLDDVSNLLKLLTNVLDVLNVLGKISKKIELAKYSKKHMPYNRNVNKHRTSLKYR